MREELGAELATWTLKQAVQVIIARDNKPVLPLVPLAGAGGPRQPGTARGQVWMAPDFDTTPEDFADYL